MTLQQIRDEVYQSGTKFGALGKYTKVLVEMLDKAIMAKTEPIEGWYKIGDIRGAVSGKPSDTNYYVNEEKWTGCLYSKII